MTHSHVPSPCRRAISAVTLPSGRRADLVAINARVKSDVVVDVGVQEFTYEPVSEIRGRPAP